VKPFTSIHLRSPAWRLSFGEKKRTRQKLFTQSTFDVAIRGGERRLETQDPRRCEPGDNEIQKSIYFSTAAQKKSKNLAIGGWKSSKIDCEHKTSFDSLEFQRSQRASLLLYSVQTGLSLFRAASILTRLINSTNMCFDCCYNHGLGLSPGLHSEELLEDNDTQWAKDG
jgi:hypothetical protein